MQNFVEIDPLRAHLKHLRSKDLSIGLVPTMGALHAGHLSLISASKTQNDITVCSIYVNPVQFNNPTDLEKYPRTLEADSQLLKQAGCDILFCPDNVQMYKEASRLRFDFGDLDKILEGQFRPGHFSGVALVVAKLFNIVVPDRAYFGQKDFQQFMVISRLAEELKFDLELISAPIIREADGLAMSSRNARLNADERQRAVVLNTSLREAKAMLLEAKSVLSVKQAVAQRCAASNVKLEYFALADRRDLTLLDKLSEPSNAVILIAAYVGDVRLIDNILLTEA